MCAVGRATRGGGARPSRSQSEPSSRPNRSSPQPTDSRTQQPAMASRTASQAIPTTKRVLLSDPNQLPANYSTTPGGTLFSTTPGGTRIVYERSTLMYLRNSPLSKTPPNIPDLPDSMCRGDIKSIHKNGLRTSPLKKAFSDDRGEQFEIDL